MIESKHLGHAREIAGARAAGREESFPDAGASRRVFARSFPFSHLPRRAQAIGAVLPLTHFLRIVRGILLKGNALPDVSRDLWPIVLFAAIMLTIGIQRYRQTLD